MRNTSQTIAIVLVLAPVFACTAPMDAASSPATPTAASAVETTLTAADAATEATAARPPHFHPGPDFLIFAALHEPIGLTADQEKTVQALLPTAPHAFDKARAAELAAEIRAGKVDVTADGPAPADRAAHEAALASALRTLHATLTPAQRRALVDAIERREADHAANDPDRRGGFKDRAGVRGPLEHLLRGLDVTAGQEQEIEAKLTAAHPGPSETERAALSAQHDAMRAGMRAKLETFASDSFVGTAFVTPPGGPMKPGGPSGFLTDVAIVTSVFDAAQREKLAERIEAGPPADGHDHEPPGQGPR
jgi:hypothetical protein